MTGKTTTFRCPNDNIDLNMVVMEHIQMYTSAAMEHIHYQMYCVVCGYEYAGVTAPLLVSPGPDGVEVIAA